MRNFVVAVLASALPVGACSYAPAISDAEYAKEAEARALAEVRSPTAHIISTKANGRIPKACGWMDLGPGRGITIFQVEGRTGEQYSTVSVPVLGGETRKDRTASLFYRQLTLVTCNEIVPPPPAGSFVETPASVELAALWAEAPQKRAWAVIEPDSDGVFVGVHRRKGGGLMITPGFRSRDAVESWIRAEGDAAAKASQDAGAAAMKRHGECLVKANDEAAMDQCPSEGMDETVELDASDAWRGRTVEDRSAK